MKMQEIERLEGKPNDAPRADQNGDRRDDRPELTAREREVLAAVASGFSSKMIADQMGISIHTVKVHRAHVYLKLRVRSVGEAVRTWLVREG